jgi:hypothetical protein
VRLCVRVPYATHCAGGRPKMDSIRSLMRRSAVMGGALWDGWGLVSAGHGEGCGAALHLHCWLSVQIQHNGLCRPADGDILSVSCWRRHRHCMHGLQNCMGSDGIACMAAKLTVPVRQRALLLLLLHQPVQACVCVCSDAAWGGALLAG